MKMILLVCLVFLGLAYVQGTVIPECINKEKWCGYDPTCDSDEVKHKCPELCNDACPVEVVGQRATCLNEVETLKQTVGNLEAGIQADRAEIDDLLENLDKTKEEKEELCQMVDCNNQNAQNICRPNFCHPVDGQWSDSQPWSDCSVACGPGSITRNRTCTNPPAQAGGKECLGLSEETKPCPVITPCPSNISMTSSCDSTSDSQSLSLFTPNYGAGPNADYGLDRNCTWALISPPGLHIQLNAFEYDTEDGYDYLYIYEGNNTSDEPIVNISGTGNQGQITSSGNTLYLKFTSDDGKSFSGFKIYYQLFGTGLGILSTCGSTSNSEEKSLYTPNYMDGNTGRYENDAYCTWRILTEPGSRIILKSFRYATERRSGDILSLYDGPSERSRKLVQVSGRGHQELITSAGNALYVTFTSDQSKQESGFKIYAIKHPCYPSSPCKNGATCTSVSGELNCECSIGYYGEQCEVPPMAMNFIGHPDGSMVTIKENDELELKCNVSGARPKPKVEWYKDGNKFDPESFVSETEFPSSICDGCEGIISTLTLQPTFQDNQASFRCKAVHTELNANSSLRTNGKAVVLNVLYAHGQPRIMEDISVFHEGQNKEITCRSMEGNPLPSITWFKGKEDITEIATFKDDASKFSRSVLKITANRSDNDIQYRCEAKNEAIDRPLNAKVNMEVQFAPSSVSITADPNISKAGQNTTLTCTSGSSNPSASIVWKRADATFHGINKEPAEMCAFKGNCTTNRLEVHPTAELDGAVYICVATNEDLAISVHNNITLRVNYEPIFLDAPVDGNEIEDAFEVEEGKSRIINLRAKANPPQLEYTYSRDTVSIPNVADALPESSLVALSNGSLSVRNARRQDTGMYMINAENSEGSTNLNFRLNVLYAPSISDITKNVSVYLHETAKMICVVDANPITEHTAKWTSTNVRQNRMKTLRNDGAFHLTVSNVTQADAGEFTCTVDNGIGEEVKSSTYLHVKDRCYPSSPCKNGGTCTSHSVNYCQCSIGYNGEQCEIKVPEYCKRYQNISDAWRKIHLEGGATGSNCDNSGFSGYTWYRFVGPAGTELPTSPPQKRLAGKQVCGTTLPAWIKGNNPTIQEGITSKEVCFACTNQECCLESNGYGKININVAQCPGSPSFFIYQLKNTPACPSAYCAL